MLHKAWPPELVDKKLNEKDEDMILLKHLLTWSTWQGFLKFIGKKTIKLEFKLNSINDSIFSLVCPIATIWAKNVWTVSRN